VLDERRLKICELLAEGKTMTSIAESVGVSRNTIYEWKKEDEVKARLAELEQDFISSTKRAVIGYGPQAVAQLKRLAEGAESEKVRLDATKTLLDKVISNATRIELTDGRDNADNVNIDVLNEEIKEFDID
jgi:transposase-like protein